MKATYLCPWHKMTTWFSPLSRMLATSNVSNGIVERLAPAVNIYVLLKNRVLALSCMEDEAPPASGGRNGGSDVL